MRQVLLESRTRNRPWNLYQEPKNPKLPQKRAEFQFSKITKRPTISILNCWLDMEDLPHNCTSRSWQFKPSKRATSPCRPFSNKPSISTVHPDHHVPVQTPNVKNTELQFELHKPSFWTTPTAFSTVCCPWISPDIPTT